MCMMHRRHNSGHSDFLPAPISCPLRFLGAPYLISVLHYEERRRRRCTFHAAPAPCRLLLPRFPFVFNDLADAGGVGARGIWTGGDAHGGYNIYRYANDIFKNRQNLPQSAQPAHAHLAHPEITAKVCICTPKSTRNKPTHLFDK